MSLSFGEKGLEMCKAFHLGSNGDDYPIGDVSTEDVHD